MPLFAPQSRKGRKEKAGKGKGRGREIQRFWVFFTFTSVLGEVLCALCFFAVRIRAFVLHP
ncbi:MAG: hypothetical protein KAR36_13395, partial [Candidatus Latescibacteria bacterium]|nr:hypothetical protein [Candidatus Latescibacterota bacterium]